MWPYIKCVFFLNFVSIVKLLVIGCHFRPMACQKNAIGQKIIIYAKAMTPPPKKILDSSFIIVCHDWQVGDISIIVVHWQCYHRNLSESLILFIPFNLHMFYCLTTHLLASCIVIRWNCNLFTFVGSVCVEMYCMKTDLKAEKHYKNQH